MEKYTSTEILDILQKHRELLRKYRVKKIGLFGSFSRNESTVGSDIDFVVDFEEKSFDNFMDLSFALEEIFRREVDLLTDNTISHYIYPSVKNEIQWYEA
ncbi:MAG: nucleotidyltransferase family protein [Bacteroidetes bacterium]|nr:nucleotidyltransferase family protein [Bacteroidota bacterium]MBU1679430.1 nucleotidyltransferase family protein [Bacteroidota bacterium]